MCRKQARNSDAFRNKRPGSSWLFWEAVDDLSQTLNGWRQHNSEAQTTRVDMLKRGGRNVRSLTEERQQGDEVGVCLGKLWLLIFQQQGTVSSS